MPFFSSSCSPWSTCAVNPSGGALKPKMSHWKAITLAGQHLQERCSTSKILIAQKTYLSMFLSNSAAVGFSSLAHKFKTPISRTTSVCSREPIICHEGVNIVPTQSNQWYVTFSRCGNRCPHLARVCRQSSLSGAGVDARQAVLSGN